MTMQICEILGIKGIFIKTVLLLQKYMFKEPKRSCVVHCYGLSEAL